MLELDDIIVDEQDEFATLLQAERLRTKRATSTVSSNRKSQPRWKIFAQAVLYLGEIMVEICRRCIRWIKANAPMILIWIDGCLVRFIRVSVHPYKQVNALRVLILLLFVLSVPFLLYTIQKVQQSSRSDLQFKLTEKDIQPKIIVEVEGKQKADHHNLLRQGNDGLKPDDTTEKCQNTCQGINLITDSQGFVCSRGELDQVKRGCCNTTSSSNSKQFQCEKCDVNPPHCCNIYEMCVSCCMHPLNISLRRDFLLHVDPKHPVYSDPSEITVFQYCQFRCRTSSGSAYHQTSYRSHRKFCYGIHRPLKVLPTVNSDDVDDELVPASLEGVTDAILSESILELDPLYRLEK